jgi:aubergine-like protein
VPELCRLTGLTEEMRSNYKLMSALAEHTRVGPNKRIEKLLAFGKRLRNEKKVCSFLTGNLTVMQFARHLCPASCLTCL